MYILERENGTRHFADNQALRTGSARYLSKLVGGEEVPAQNI